MLKKPVDENLLAKEAPVSPAVQLLKHVWDFSLKETGYSWERLNHSMHMALRLAVGSGFLFFPWDLSVLEKRFRSAYWIGSDDEWVYSLAVLVGHKSAISMYEDTYDREPIIADDVDPACPGGSTEFLHRVGRRARERLTVGSKLQWKGEQVEVTSWTANGVIACSYRRKGEPKQCATCGRYDYTERELVRRFTITRADVLAERAARKAKARE